jgi:hypothetical protein
MARIVGEKTMGDAGCRLRDGTGKTTSNAQSHLTLWVLPQKELLDFKLSFAL